MTSPSLPTAPPLGAIDETAIRTLFPDAPADLSVPTDVRSMFAARMRGFGGEYRMLVWIGWGAAFLVALVLAAAGMITAALVVAGVAIVAAIGVAAWQHSSASDEFFDRYAAARGLTHVERGRVKANVPLLSHGDERKYPRVLSGRIFGEPAQLAHYTYTEISTDSKGNETRTDHDYTILCTRLPPAVADRYRGVYLSPRKLSLGALQDKLAHDRKVELESSEFAKRYTLRVVDEQDDIALYELFSTTFVHRLATELHVHWEQRGADIVFWERRHETEAADLDALCQRAAHVLQRYHEEFQ
jgi:hypothetical protein